MQDIHGGSGRLFAGGSGGGDRRSRPNHNHNHSQALKCPRCDSLNTKFCYYNNYNLSQPRHFCKSCRRYWTKGGVLRNVPVGGGCRKNKRSKTKQPTVSTDAGAATGAGETAAGAAAVNTPGERNSNSHSSSESSSLTATTTAAKKAPPAGSSGEVADSRFFVPQINHFQPLIDPAVTSDGQVFTTEMGSFTSLMTSSSHESAVLGFGNAGYQWQQSRLGSVVEDQSSKQMVGNALKMEEEQMNCGFLDQTGQIGFSGLEQSKISNFGLSGFDWQINGGGGGVDGGGEEQELFDFTGTVDQAYWSQNQWADNDQSLNFPPLV